jgi:2-oxoglutarate dehydrogenase E2 component (dihydrolipoamide succinyltransferase)
MQIELKVPSVGESISEVVVGQILKPDGSLVRQDEELLEFESEKVNQVLVAPAAGQLRLTVQTGQTLAIGAIIGSIDTSVAVQAPPPAPPAPAAAHPGPLVTPTPPPSSIASAEGSLRIQTAEWVASTPSKVSPPPTPEGSAPQGAPSTPTPTEDRRPMSKMRQTIARRLVETQQSTASLTTFNEVDMTAVVNLRAKYKELFQKEHGIGLGFMSFFMKACVDGLQHFPDLNAYIDGNEIVQRNTYNLSIAVSTDRGLVVPVIRDCNKKSFAQLEAELAALAQQARANQLSVAQMQGGGFTITNAGVFGSLLSTPILNAPQVGILGMHRILPRPVAVGDKVEIRPMMYLALTYDHRIVDGKEAVSFLVHVKQVLEDPSRMMLEV